MDIRDLLKEGKAEKVAKLALKDLEKMKKRGGEWSTLRDLLPLLSDRDEMVRSNAVFALSVITGKLREVREDPIIEAMLSLFVKEDNDPLVRINAINALALVAFAYFEKPPVGYDQESVIRIYLRRIIDETSEGLNDSDARVRAIALRALNFIVTHVISKGGNELLKLLLKPELPKLIHPLIPKVTELLKDEDKLVRGYVAVLLGNIGDTYALDRLEELRTDNSEVEIFLDFSSEKTIATTVGKEASEAVKKIKTCMSVSHQR